MQIKNLTQMKLDFKQSTMKQLFIQELLSSWITTKATSNAAHHEGDWEDVTGYSNPVAWKTQIRAQAGKWCQKFIEQGLGRQQRCNIKKLITPEQNKEKNKPKKSTFPSGVAFHAGVSGGSKEERKSFTNAKGPRDRFMPLPCIFCDSAENRSGKCSTAIERRKEIFKRKGLCLKCSKKGLKESEPEPKSETAQVGKIWTNRLVFIYKPFRCPKQLTKMLEYQFGRNSFPSTKHSNCLTSYVTFRGKP